MKILSFAFILALAACSRFESTSPWTNSSLLDSLTYGKDKYGVCYAFAKDLQSGGVKFTSVPCEKVGL